IILAPRSQRAQGRPGARRTHGPPATRKAGGSHHRSAVTSGLPCAMVLTAAPRSPRCTGLCSHRRLPIIFGKLDPSVGGSGPHGLAVRIGRARPARRHVHRIPLPTFVTIAKRPSWSGTGRAETIIFFRKTEDKYFCGGGLTRLPIKRTERRGLF